LSTLAQVVYPSAIVQVVPRSPRNFSSE